MDNANFLLWIGGFFCGYIVKGLFSLRGSYTASAVFVERMAEQCLKLLGTAVYKVAYMEQIYKNSIMMAKGTEAAKVASNELAYEFEIWKKNTINEFLEKYPEQYKWQLEYGNWQEAMESLTDVYKKDRLKNNGEPQKHIK